jgi:hypothetical protein
MALAGGRRRRCTGWDSRAFPRYRSHTGVRGCCGKAEGRAYGASCAGTHVSGDLGSNECPADSVRIEAEAACRTAAAAAGKTPYQAFVETDAGWPRGCYYTTSNTAYFNTHLVGAGLARAQLLCAVVSAGAPIRARACTLARLRSGAARARGRKV